MRPTQVPPPPPLTSTCRRASPYRPEPVAAAALVLALVLVLPPLPALQPEVSAAGAVVSQQDLEEGSARDSATRHRPAATTIGLPPWRLAAAAKIEPGPSRTPRLVGGSSSSGGGSSSSSTADDGQQDGWSVANYRAHRGQLGRRGPRVAGAARHNQAASTMAGANNSGEKFLMQHQLAPLLHIQVSAIHVDRAEFPLSELLFRLTLRMALDEARRELAKVGLELVSSSSSSQSSANESSTLPASNETAAAANAAHEPSALSEAAVSGGAGQREQHQHQHQHQQQQHQQQQQQQQVQEQRARRRIRLSLNVRSANTCSRQYAAGVAAEEYYTQGARLFIVSGCDDAIRGVARLAALWRVPVMTAAGFGADLDNKQVYGTLVRVAFSLRTAAEFLGQVMRSYSWHRVNIIVDESDTNSVSLREGIEGQLSDARLLGNFNTTLNVISIDFGALMSLSLPEQGAAAGSGNASRATGANNNNNNNNWRTGPPKARQLADEWPNRLMNGTIRDSLRQSSMFSRVNILLIPQHFVRRFMLSVYDQGMANGMYAFINMPLLLATGDDDPTPDANSSAYLASTGDSEFLWRSPAPGARNAHARQAFESLMSIYVRTPTTKAYLHLASKITQLANSGSSLMAAGGAVSLATGASFGSNLAPNEIKHKKHLLSMNPYSAAFYDCLIIYARVLNETLGLVEREFDADKQRLLERSLHDKVVGGLRNRRFDNLATGTVLLNKNGDREADYTLDDLNQMTGKFWPVFMFMGGTHTFKHLARIQWSSNLDVGPTVDSVECHLTNTCPKAPWSQFAITLLLLGAPFTLAVSVVLYLVYQKIMLESQLVDYWWRIPYKEIELITSRRKTAASAGNCSTVLTGDSGVSARSSDVDHVSAIKDTDSKVNAHPHKAADESGVGSGLNKTGSVTWATTAMADNSAAEVCYGNINLGLYKLSKVALKPIDKFHQSRKLMIELRTLKTVSHNNLCRFVGIVVEEPNLALVNEFCPKGSLREFFQNDSMVIDWTFKYSIMNDILAGLTYLHSSALEYHGRLKSSNCLVSSRFVVKLSDYGIRSLYEQIDSVEEDTVLLAKQTWLAPEHISTSGSSGGGSKLGDVYSFGLLLYEVASNQLPFFDSVKSDFSMPLQKLVAELKHNGPTNLTGPNTDSIDSEGVESHHIKSLIDLMKQCWSRDQSKRPNLAQVSTAIKKVTGNVTSKNLLENLTSRMEQYSNNLESLVDAKLATLLEEKQKAEELLYQFVPRSIALRLKEGQTVEPEAYDCVTVFYSDIVGFTSLSSESTPMEVIDFLNDVYLCFDQCLENYDIFKVDTIGDAYIVASGLPQRNEGKHVVEIAYAALELRDRLREFKIAHRPDRSLQMRVGIHSGPCVAGIVGGLNMPKYCIFGDTLTMGNFMEHHGLPMKIHITEKSKELLGDSDGFQIEQRQPSILMEGVPFPTYWLERA